MERKSACVQSNWALGLHAASQHAGVWMAEGFTNYYGHLMQRRAGIWDDANFCAAKVPPYSNIENSPAVV